MSSDERDIPELPALPKKKRRIQRACDLCRQKRRACDGLRMSAKKCSYCIENGMECIYSGAATTTKRKSYTDVLEARLALTEKLLRKASLSSKSGDSPETTESSEWSKDSPVTQPTGDSGSVVGPGVELAAMSIRTLHETKPVSADSINYNTELLQMELADHVQRLSLKSHDNRFLGSSSGAALIRAAVKLKDGYDADAPPETRPTPWGSRRLEYWTLTPWKEQLTPKPRYDFPPADALAALIDLYFEHIHLYQPLLHRPTFERLVADGLHLSDEKFGATVLLVCAIGSRFSDDPRVYDPRAPLMCGWNYYAQLPSSADHLFDAPTLYDLQRVCLSIQFLDGSAPQANWGLVGIGLRIAQEAGAHRRQANNAHPTVESELWKRAFWVLVWYDRLGSTTLGRPCAIQYDDFDIDLPTEVDDDFWQHEDPAQAFCQPPGTPPRVAFFNAALRLNNILAFSLRILYSLDKAKELLALRDPAWEEHLLAELDSALNKWVDLIPEHLRWDPERTDTRWFRQSVALYCAYCHVQMTTHRPFIPMIRQAAPTALPSLAICTNAARSCTHVVDVALRRMGNTPAITLLPALTTAGVVLLLNVWSGKRTGLPPHMNTALAEVHKCMRAMHVLEGRWQMAGLFWDILNELAGVAPAPQVSPVAPVMPSTVFDPTPVETVNHLKRTHADSETVYQPAHVQEQEPPLFAAPVPTAAAWTTFNNVGHFAWVGTDAQAGSLPMYSTDLGRLPTYPPPFAGANAYVTPAAWAAVPGFQATPFQPPVDAQAGPSRFPGDGDMLDDAIAMWANAPAGLGADEWSTYFRLMNEINQEGRS
ncbi:fungal-specific transcription factor domain-containing protein [Mycena crocata]|nr:fungal-specific transcription factor domain-containing protein [Mycena crocata]